MTRRKGKRDEVAVGSYLFSLQENSSGHWLVVRSISNDWSVRWSDAHMMFGILGGLIGNARCHKYVEALVTMIYTASSYPHDMAAVVEQQQLPFINGFCELVKQQTDLEVSFAEKPTDKEDEEALEETVHLQELQDEIEALDDEVHGE